MHLLRDMHDVLEQTLPLLARRPHALDLLQNILFGDVPGTYQKLFLFEEFEDINFELALVLHQTFQPLLRRLLLTGEDIDRISTTNRQTKRMSNSYQKVDVNRALQPTSPRFDSDRKFLVRAWNASSGAEKNRRIDS